MEYFYEISASRPPYQRPHIFAEVDENGYLKPMFTDQSFISILQEDVIADLVREYQKFFHDALKAVYFRGFAHFDNDKIRFDCIVITKQLDARFAKLPAYLNSVLGYKYSFLKYYNTQVYSDEDIAKSRYIQFLLKILCLRVYGQDYESEIPPFAVSDEIFYSIKVLEKKLNELEQHWWRPEMQAVASKHVIKHLIRASFEVVAKKEKGYTRDLTMCHQLFIKHYPQHEAISKKIYEYLSKPPSPLDVEFLNDVRRFTESLKSIYESNERYLQKEHP